MTKAGLALLGCAVLLAACSVGEARDTGGKIEDAASMQHEYRVEVGRVGWPPKVTPPPSAVQGDESTQYQVGVGAASADFNWMCAWIGEWLDTHASDPLRAGNALSALEKAPQLPVWRMWDGNGHTALNNAISSARKSDEAPFQVMYGALSCPALFGASPRP
jgi:hypothetical protein